MPGPVPKRAAERRRRNLDGRVDSAPPLVAAVEQPPADKDWHAVALAWYESLATSGQAQFYEPSDWATAYYVAEAMSRNLSAGKFSAMLFASVMSAMTELLTTEGARRRARLEIERGEAEVPASVSAMDEYRKRLAVGGK